MSTDRKTAATAIATPLLALAIGIAIGCAIWRSEPAETEVVPAASMGNFSPKTLQEFCGHNAVFSDFTKADAALSNGERVQKRVDRLQMAATPLSDRGVICSLTATVLTRRTQPNGDVVESTSDEHMTYIVAVNGESEVVTADFAKALLASKTVRVMASNLGNDGTVVPVVKVAPLN